MDKMTASLLIAYVRSEKSRVNSELQCLRLQSADRMLIAEWDGQRIAFEKMLRALGEDHGSNA